MQRYILTFTLALFLGTATFADAQEQVRTSAEIQEEIDKLQIELQKAQEAERVIPRHRGLPQRPESERRIFQLLEMPVTLPVDETTTFYDLMRIINARVDENLPIHFDREAIQNSSTASTIRSDSTINPEGYMPTDNMKLKNALKVLLEPHGLTYIVKNEMLYITSIEQARREVFTRTYYVGDIVPVVSAEEESRVEKTDTAESGLKCCAGCTCAVQQNNPVMMSEWVWWRWKNLSIRGTDRLIIVIMTTIDPYSWSVNNAGGDGVLQMYTPTQSLIVHATDDVHAQIEEFLTVIRKMHALHQAVQAGVR